MRRRIESRRQGVVVGTGLCGLSRCEGCSVRRRIKSGRRGVVSTALYGLSHSCGRRVGQRIESARRGVFVSTGLCGFSRCVSVWCVRKLGVYNVELAYVHDWVAFPVLQIQGMPVKLRVEGDEL